MFYYYIMIFILGSVWSSFSCCFAYRYQHNLSILYPNSRCDNCLKALKFWQLIPILGYCLQRGRCFYCHAKIPSLSLITELSFSSYLTFICSIYPFDSWFTLIILCSWTLLLILTDSLTKTVPTYFLICGGLVLCFFNLHILLATNIIDLFFLLYFSCILILFSLSRKLGSGDSIYLIFLGFIYGLIPLLIIIIISCLLSFCYFYTFKSQKSVAFIPFIGISLFLILCFMQ